MYIYPYRLGSETIKALADGFEGGKTIRLENSKFRGGPNKKVLNWGSSVRNAEVESSWLLNHPEQVGLASNKKTFFNLCRDAVSLPEFTTNIQEARSFLDADKWPVVVREKLTGHSGEGIVLLNDEVEWDRYDHNLAKLYVKYVPKKDEYRVHVFRGEVLFVQRKAVRKGTRPENYQIRNVHNGFIYQQNDFTCPPDVQEEAVKALNCVGLDFGAVDVIYNVHREKAYVLEINTAPGLENTTLNTYIEAIGNYFKVKTIPGKIGGDGILDENETFDIETAGPVETRPLRLDELTPVIHDERINPDIRAFVEAIQADAVDFAPVRAGGGNLGQNRPLWEFPPIQEGNGN